MNASGTRNGCAPSIVTPRVRRVNSQLVEPQRIDKHIAGDHRPLHHALVEAARALHDNHAIDERQIEQHAGAARGALRRRARARQSRVRHASAQRRRRFPHPCDQPAERIVCAGGALRSAPSPVGANVTSELTAIVHVSRSRLRPGVSSVAATCERRQLARMHAEKPPRLVEHAIARRAHDRDEPARPDDQQTPGKARLVPPDRHREQHDVRDQKG
jgi:hypothetical protein